MQLGWVRSYYMVYLIVTLRWFDSLSQHWLCIKRCDLFNGWLLNRKNMCQHLTRQYFSVSLNWFQNFKKLLFYSYANVTSFTLKLYAMLLCILTFICCEFLSSWCCSTVVILCAAFNFGCHITVQSSEGSRKVYVVLFPMHNNFHTSQPPAICAPCFCI